MLDRRRARMPDRYFFPEQYLLCLVVEMSLFTRGVCDPTIELPYYNRAFNQTTNLPAYGIGGNYGLTQGVERESTLTMPWHMRAPKGCSDSIEYHPDLIFDPQITRWQQDDFRICHFTDGTRDDVKKMCTQPAPRFRYFSEDKYGGATNEFIDMYKDFDV
jgi:hypothetical protein